VARNRKRAKERRARRPQPVASRRDGRDDTPDPIAHAAPDVELAEAQLALGRPELPIDVDAEDDQQQLEPIEDEAGFAEVLSAEEYDDDEEPEPEGVGGGRGRVRIGAGFDGEAGGGGGAGGAGAAAAAVPHPGAVEPRIGLLARLIGFIQGSWRELQRVQWPDRRQVAQATAVVIGFVIVAAVFLGVADLAFSHLVNYVLYGK
jgi:preprotein translocase subunit SecE